jgi:hypothetical protein
VKWPVAKPGSGFGEIDYQEISQSNKIFRSSKTFGRFGKGRHIKNASESAGRHWRFW